MTETVLYHAVVSPRFWLILDPEWDGVQVSILVVRFQFLNLRGWEGSKR